jgi:hypothetical protein
MRLKKLKAGLWSCKMKRLPFRVIIVICVFFLGYCASAPMSVLTDNVVIPPDYAGIVHAGRTAAEEEFAYLNYLGASWVLNTFYWDRIEYEPGKWNFSGYDTFVNNNITEGFKVLGVLAYDVGWIHKDGKSRDYIPPERIPDFLQFVRNTAEHFRGKVDGWCIWNEPNGHFWKGTADEFAELSRQAADAVREVDSDVILLGGAFNRGVFGLPERFIRKLFESGAMDRVDGVAFHPYELNPSRTLALYNRFRKIVDDYGFGNKIWITEVGYPTGGLYPTRVREDRLPEYVIKTFVLLSSAGSNKLLWYELFDSVERSNSNSEDFFGLVRSELDYTSKGAEAFRLCASYLPGSICYVLAPGGENLPGSMRLFWYKKTGGGALVLWYEGLGSKQVLLRLDGTELVNHDLVTGAESQIQADTVVRVGRTPVFITWDESENRPEIRLF